MATHQPQTLLRLVRQGYGGTIKWDHDSISHEYAYAGTFACFTCVGVGFTYAQLLNMVH